MKLRFNLQALEPAVPGRARLYVRDIDGELELGEYAIAIQRSQGARHYLHSANSWDASLRWLPQQGWTEYEEGIAVLVGVDIVDSLLANASDAYQITLADADGESLGHSTLKLDTAILPSTAGGNAQAMELTMPVSAPAEVAPELPVETPPVAEVPEPPAEPVKVEPPPPPKVEAPAPVPETPPAKKGGMGKWIALLLLLLIVAGAAGYWFYSQSAKDSPAAPDAPEPKPAVAQTGACAMDKLKDRPGLQFVQECVKEDKTSEQWLAVIEEAKSAEQCDVAQRLYVNKAQSGDVKIAMAYAREYDPKDHQAHACFSKPNPATAAYWYETVLLSEPDNAQAKARFQELSQ